MTLRHLARHAVRALPIAYAVLVGTATRTGAQEQEQPRLGLAATGALSLGVGLATVRAADPAFEAGMSLDLGRTFHPTLRLVLDVELLTGRLGRTDSVGVRARGNFYDGSAHVGLRWISRLGELAVPYGAFGVGVHALGSSTGNPEVDALYNRNLFGLHGAVGFYSPLSESGRNAISLELRGVSAGNVRRASVRLAMTRFFRDLVVPVRVR